MVWRSPLCLLLTLQWSGSLSTSTAVNGRAAASRHRAAPLAAIAGSAPVPVLLHSEAIIRQAPCLQPAAEALLESDGHQLERMAKALAVETRYLDTSPDWPHRRRMALEVAYLAHLGQARRSGEPYVIHPVEVALILARSRMDEASIISG